MADTYGRLTERAGVCSATLGPGATNLLLGTADAQHGTPLSHAQPPNRERHHALTNL